MDDQERMRRHYAVRDSGGDDRYHASQPDVALGSAAIDVATIGALREAGITQFQQLTALEVGSGTGTNLLRLLRWGFLPENLTGCELIAGRHARARTRLPETVDLIHGDARDLPSDAAYDVVLQSTVLSSILDDQVQEQVAATMWDCLRPGGVVLSLDLGYRNPRNDQVRAVPRRRLQELFPGQVRARRVLLAPPVSRRLGWHPAAYVALHAVPLLRSHLLATIRKPL